jgi:hypothetical protein
MKKILTLIVLTSAFLYAQAQEKVPNTPFQHSEYFLESLQHARSMGQDVYVDEDVQPAAPQATPIAKIEKRPIDVGYLNPTGTMFLGMDERGKGSFISSPGVIGGWSDSIPCWKWLNQRIGYRSIKYVTAFSDAYPSNNDGENYAVDEYGNFCDTIVASGGYQPFKDGYGDDDSWWPHSMPYQTVRTSEGKEVNYMMLTTSTSKPSVLKWPIVAGGLPSGNTSDGLWPLTNAVSTTTKGVSMDLVDYIAGDGYVSYLFGTSEYTVDSVAVPKYDMTGDSMTYTRVKPVELLVHYDKPQTPLYVKNITMAIGSYIPEDLSVNTMDIEVRTENGKLIATSSASMWDMTDMSYKPGKLLTFRFQKFSEYGELLDEGFLVDEAFKIKITGFAPEYNFGIYAAQCYVHATKAEMVYEGGLISGIEYEPYIMLNGIYPTLEDYYRSYEIETGQVGDTIPVNMISYNADGYQYTAAYAKWGTSNTEFAFYSTFMPYDSISRLWTMDIYKPKYIRLAADFDTNLNSDPEDDPITLWSYYRIFTLHIYATKTPQIGDCIKIGKFGKYIVFRIDAINGSTDPNANIGANETDIHNASWEDSKAEKFIQDGQLYIRKNNKVYNVVGQQIQNQ